MPWGAVREPTRRPDVPPGVAGTDPTTGESRRPRHASPFTAIFPTARRPPAPSPTRRYQPRGRICYYRQMARSLASALVAVALLGCAEASDAPDGSAAVELSWGSPDAASAVPDTGRAAADAIAPLELSGPTTDTASDVVSPDLAMPDLLPDTPAPDAATALDSATDAAADAVPDSVPHAASDSAADSAAPPPPSAPPDQWGPYPVGTRAYTFFDPVRLRWLATQVWYPSQPSTDSPAVYVGLIPGKAVVDVAPDSSKSPWPIVLFSHGFKGINAQSVGFTEYVASHGYVVVAPNHPGNTLFDFGSKDKDVAQTSLERPKDLAFALSALLSLDAGDPLHGLADATRVAVTGHSFGGWTALIVAGGNVDVDAAKAACDSGAPSDIFCKYLPYFPAGQTIALAPAMAGLKAAVILAPGGYSSLGDPGLAKVGIATLVMGGTLDKTTPVPIEIDPIYAGLAQTGHKMEVVLEKADHMSYTNICAVPGAAAFIPDFCGDPNMLSGDKALAAAGAFAVAWLGTFVKGELGMLPYLDTLAKTPTVASSKKAGW